MLRESAVQVGEVGIDQRPHRQVALEEFTEEQSCLGHGRLGERVIAKHLKAIGFGHLVDKNMGPPLKTILYNHAEGRYFVHEQE